ncbi:MAG TPA: hypothetical protein VFE70_07365, partial [Candidatus Elarobacter sp.]|nr:hypothetical protein [Candidatus Elarobacter sp.]
MKSALALIAATIAASLAAADAAAKPPATIVHRFAAYDTDGKLRSNLRVTKRIAGSCWIGSIVTTRTDAWRCDAGNVIYDPCFAASDSAREVACVPDPFSPQTTMMRLTKSLPHGDDDLAGNGGLPWGLRTTDGHRCAFAAGMTNIAQHLRANYFCPDGTVYYGAPDSHAQPWSIAVGSAGALRGSVRIGILEAVF